MNRCAELGETILLADSTGDRPAIVTKVFSATSVEACAYAPMPEHIRVASIHVDRWEAINCTLRDAGYHAYWKP